MAKVLQIALESAVEWIRRALDFDSHRQTSADITKKLKVIRLAGRHCYPTGEIEDMLAEIEAGYRGRVKT
jgi:negative regulator of replication initiation